jgi:hypothetical protein
LDQPTSHSTQKSEQKEAKDFLYTDSHLHKSPNMADNTPRYGSFPITGVPMLEHGLPIQHWTEGFTAYLSINGHINIIDNPYNNGLSIEGTVVPRLAGAALTKWNMTQRIAMIALKQRLGNEAKALIAAGTYTNCQSIMDKLNERFKPQGAGAFIDLCDALNNMTLSSYSNLTEYTAEFRRIDKDINALDSSLALPMPYMIQRYLQGLGPQFTPFRKTFNQINSVIPLSGVNSISFDQTVLKTELEIASQSQDEIQTAFYVKPTYKTASPSNQHIRHHGAVSEKVNGDTKTIVIPHCSYCNRDYHTHNECATKHPALMPELKRKRAERQERFKKKQATSASSTTLAGLAVPASSTSVTEVHDVLLAANNTSFGSLAREWMLDSGCGKHIAWDRNSFIDYTPIPPHKQVQYNGINNSVTHAIGTGTIRLFVTSPTGTKQSLDITNVNHCPDAGVNLICLAQLLQKKATVTVTLAGFLISTPQGLTFTTSCINNIFPINLWGSNPISAFANIDSDTLQLWHERLGHLSPAKL